MKKFLIKLIKEYQVFSKKTPLLGQVPFLVNSGCRFYPTCSDYAIEALNKHGTVKGGTKSVLRVLKCNPLFSAGVDNP